MWAWLEKTASDPRKLLAIDILIVVALFALAIAFTLVALETRDALCKFRSELAGRTDSAQAFLDEHPGVKQIRLGDVTITRGQIDATLDKQKSTLDSLGGLNC